MPDAPRRDVPRLASGVLLVAPPILDDPNFFRAVVLLCEYDDEGAFGLVLNNPLDLTLSNVLEGFDATDAPLLQGGPVQPETLHVLHRRPDLMPGARPLAGGIHWGGEFDALTDHFASGEAAPDDFRFYLGYAGWSAGQIDAEMERGDWLLADAHADFLFGTEPADVWPRVLRSMGEPYSYLVHYPPDPRMN